MAAASDADVGELKLVSGEVPVVSGVNTIGVVERDESDVMAGVVRESSQELIVSADADRRVWRKINLT